jgi:tripartite-type tricarboxylate transporter receptor subunit TctC
MTISRRSFIGTSGAIAAASVLRVSSAGAQEEFYKNRSVRLLVGTTPGAGYDLIARLLAPALSRLIPGNPSVVVENMPGAGSLVMMNYLYNRAPRDGTVMGLPLNGVLLEPTIKLMSRAGGAANFDIQKMPWVGSSTEDAQALWFRTDSPIKSVADLKSTKSIAAASAPGADNFTVAVLTNNLLGTKMEIVRGYQGTNPIFLAIERGEAHGSATAYSAVVVTRPQWLRDGFIKVLIQYGTERLPDLPNVPTAIEIAEDPDVKEMLRIFAVKFKATYPFVLPPETPKDRVEIIRTAFDAAMKDASFLQSTLKASLPIRPRRGVEIERLIAESLKAPEKLLERLRAAVLPS